MRISQKNENSQRPAGHRPQTPSRPQKAFCLTLKFPKAARLLVRKHFQRVLRSGQKVFGRLVIVDYRAGRAHRPKLGITVSRRYGKAHLRNRFKRVVRDAFRHFQYQMPRHIEINVTPRLPFQPVSRDVILEDLEKLMSVVAHSPEFKNP